MKKIALAIGCILLSFNGFSQDTPTLALKAGEWEQALRLAQNEGKAMFIEVSKNNCEVCELNAQKLYTSAEVIDTYNKYFVNYKLTPADNKFSYIVNRYRITSYPSYIYISANGTLLHNTNGKSTVNEFIDNAQYAHKQQKVDKPIAQWDLEYYDQTLNKDFLLDYIIKRTELKLDNADIIDQYAKIAPLHEVLSKENLTLFLITNKQINVDGAFYKLVVNNQDKVKRALKQRDSDFSNTLLACVEYSFNKACNTKNEALLESVIRARTNNSVYNNTISDDLIAGEYRTKFYYFTRQPASLASALPTYANTIIQIQEKKTDQPTAEYKDNTRVNTKALFPGTVPSNDPTASTLYSIKLREAAQYVVEMLSSKSMLNNALMWSSKAIEITENFHNYETHAYVLYKLGKRSEAIDSLEKAYTKIPASDNNTRNIVNNNLIKMKRGERIW